jgi:hypothetical protein
MSYSYPNLKLPSILYFNKVKNNIQFTISGQGCIIYNFVDAPIKGYNIVLTSKDKLNKLEIKFTKDNIILIVNDVVFNKQKVIRILTDKGAYYWISLDTQNLCLKFGIGEARSETQEFYYLFDKSFKIDVLSTLSNIEFSLANFKNLKLLRDPIVGSVPLKVKNTNDLTPYDIAANTVLPKADLTTMCQKLYSNISGENFVLNTPDFPDFTEAIEYSISTPGCWAHNKLQEKSNEFGVPNPREVYLRITLGNNGGESPGIPYVMEIWPANCYSPIHNHANANAIIRVLYGQIKVFLYPFLSEIKKINNDPLLAINPDDTYGNKSFASKVFSEGDITWISAVQNQTHQLYNSNIEGPTCITIQCYMYDELDHNHYSFFDYKVEDSDKINKFDPNSDMDFLLFKETIKKEWAAK